MVVHGSDEDSDSDASDEEKDLDEIMYSPETLALLTQEIDCEWGTRHAGGCKCEWGMGVLVYSRLRANRNTLEYVNT